MKNLLPEPHFYVSRLAILLCFFLVTSIGIAFSLSYSFSIQVGRALDGTFVSHSGLLRLFIKQIMAAIIGGVGIYIIFRVNTKSWRNMSFILCCIGLIGMIFTVFFGTPINGARRWITIGGLSIQTGEFARIAFILYISHIFAHFHTLKRQGNIPSYRIKSIEKKLIIRFVIISVLYNGNLYFQKDYSSLILSVAIFLVIVFSSDIRIRIKIIACIVIILGIISIIWHSPNRMERILTFVGLSDDIFDIGFQLNQSYELIMLGGIFGNGLGSSMIHALSLPYFYNDFVFSIIIFEFGLLGAVSILFLFSCVLYYTYKVCYILYYKNKFFFYTLLGSVSFIIFSALGHIAVTVGIIPTAGINLPFYSTGGSSLVTTLFLYGFILKGAVIAEKHCAHYRNDMLSTKLVEL